MAASWKAVSGGPVWQKGPCVRKGGLRMQPQTGKTLTGKWGAAGKQDPGKPDF